MESRLDEFREFVSRYPKLRDEVRSGKKTWQNIYEEWVLYGESDQQWNQYSNSDAPKTNNPNPNKGNNENSINMDSVKNIVGYIKKINPDSLNRTLNTVQKVIQIAQSVGSKSSGPSNYISSAYNDWWD